MVAKKFEQQAHMGVELGSMCVSERDLKVHVQTCRKLCEEVWDFPPLLRGFTDHGPYHSLRVYKRLKEILGSVQLSPVQTTVLEAACWMHDIAMQDYGQLENLTPGRPFDQELTIEEYHFIRQNHAYRIRELLAADNSSMTIRGNSGLNQVSMPSLAELTPYIAEVAFGHSTKGLHEIFNLPDDEFEEGPYGQGNFNLSLLAALMLLADECDLHRSRSEKLVSSVGVLHLKPESLLHHLKHLCVSRSKIMRDPNNKSRRFVDLRYSWPSQYGSASDVKQGFIDFIETKLISQINLVNAVLAQTIGISFRELAPIKRTESISRIPRARIPNYVEPVMKGKKARATIVNLEKRLEAVLRGLEGTPVALLLEQHFSGDLGARQLAHAAIANLQLNRYVKKEECYKVVEIDASQEGCADPFDFITRLAKKAQPSVTSCSHGAFQWPDSLEEQRQYLKPVASKWPPMILVVLHAEKLPTASKEFLTKCLVPVVHNTYRHRLIIAGESEEDLLSDESMTIPWIKHEIELVTRESVLEWLGQRSTKPRARCEKILEFVFGTTKRMFTQKEARLIAVLLEV